MQTSSGLVVKIIKNKAIILTPEGEFKKVKITGDSPAIGSVYSGKKAGFNLISGEFHPIRTAAAIAFIFILFFSVGTAYAYYTPVTSVLIDINPSISLKSNRWGKVIETSSLNSDGRKILNETKLKNKTVDEALLSILEQSKKDNFINDEYIKQNKKITVFISGNSIEILKFFNNAKNNSIEVEVNENGIDKSMLYNKNTEGSSNSKNVNNQTTVENKQNKNITNNLSNKANNSNINAAEHTNSTLNSHKNDTSENNPNSSVNTNKNISNSSDKNKNNSNNIQKEHSNDKTYLDNQSTKDTSSSKKNNANNQSKR